MIHILFSEHRLEKVHLHIYEIGVMTENKISQNNAH